VILVKLCQGPESPPSILLRMPVEMFDRLNLLKLDDLVGEIAI
jgi:hypothetical protein